MFADFLATLKSLLPTKKSPTVPYLSSTPKPPPKPITTVADTWWERFKHPSGVHPRHAIIVCYLGRIGFVAKGIVYAVMGGLCISTAQHMGTDMDGVESPMVKLRQSSENRLYLLTISFGFIHSGRLHFSWTIDDWHTSIGYYVHRAPVLFCMEIVSCKDDLGCGV